MIFQKTKRILLSLVAALFLVCTLHAQTKLLRFPDVHGDKVVFTYGGDLWLASTSGGLASRLTAHPGLEVFAKFSPDGKWIAFTGQYDGDEQVYIIPVTGGVPKQLTFYPARGPLPPRWGYDNQVYGWTPDGKSVVFRSGREYFDGIFALALRKDVKNSFPPESDEVTITKEGDKPAATDGAKAEEKKPEKPEKKDEKKEEKKDEKPKQYLHIDYDGLADRITRVPIQGDNYKGLAVTKEYLIYGRPGTPFYGRDSYPPTALILFSFKDRKETTLAEGLRAFTVSDDGKKVLTRSEHDFKLYDAKPEGKANPKTVSTANLLVDRVPQREWVEIFEEVWRRYRDFYYVKNMHGYDWDALRKQYAALVPFVAHRSDLNYVLGEMVSELSTSHSYIEGGDYEMPKRPQDALPGASFELDRAAGRYRISKIYRGQNEEDLYRSPLTEVAVDAREGDYVLAIDGEDLTADKNPYQLFATKLIVRCSSRSIPSLPPTALVASAIVRSPPNAISSTSIGSLTIAKPSPKPPTAVSATSTFPIWGLLASANSSSSTIRRFARKP
jgi:tricorn protease